MTNLLQPKLCPGNLSPKKQGRKNLKVPGLSFVQKHTSLAVAWHVPGQKIKCNVSLKL